MGPQGENVLDLISVSRSYMQGGYQLDIFDELSMTLSAGEQVALVGPSGSGKSSLLHIAGLLEVPDGGTVLVNGADCAVLGDGARTAIRRTDIGFVYQFHHLLPEFTALENVVIPQRIAGVSKAQAKDRAHDLLKRLGLAERVTHRPAELSGGEQQRVALARSFANAPKLLIADEPTGNLDPDNAEYVFELFERLAAEEGLSVLMATHNLELAGRMDRVLQLNHGALVETA